MRAGTFSKAFTLLELGVALFILLLLGSAALTGLAHYRQKTEVKLQQQRILQDLSYAETLAVSRFVDTDVVFFAGGYSVLAAGQTLKEAVLPEAFTVSALRLGFNAAGNPRFAGTLYLYRRGREIAKLTAAVGSGLLKWTDI